MDALLDGPAPDAVVHRVPGPADAAATAARAHVHHVLRLLRTWQTDERLADTRLVVVTPPGSPAHAAVRGLVRSAQAENPGRYVLVEHEELPGEADLRQALATGEPELSLADGAFSVPRLTAQPSADHAVRDWGTVLVTCLLYTCWARCSPGTWSAPTACAAWCSPAAAARPRSCTPNSPRSAPR